jgi:hypothetical protein
MESDISDISNIINETIINNWRELLCVTTKTRMLLRNFTGMSMN